MKANQGISLHGKHITLIPYIKQCVPTYHDWMKSQYLQGLSNYYNILEFSRTEMTASESLTLEEEYQMQVEWQEDPEKCTFIIVCPDFKSPHANGNIPKYGGMVGDVNLFLIPVHSVNLPDAMDGKCAEIDIMIAEETERRKGLGLEAVQLMMEYASRHLGISIFIAKISERNLQSIRLFTNKLGFKELSRSSAFKEITFINHYNQTNDESPLTIEPFNV